MIKTAFENRTKAAYFDGKNTTANAKIAHLNARLSAADFNQKVTIAVLCRTGRRANGAGQDILVQRNGGALGGFRRFTLGSGAAFKPAFSLTTSPDGVASAGYSASSTIPFVGRWGWLIAIFDAPAQRMELFLNTRRIATASISNTDPIVYQTPPQTVRIGGFDTGSASAAWLGWMKCAMMFERAFTLNDIEDLVINNKFDDTNILFDFNFDNLVTKISGSSLRQNNLDRANSDPGDATYPFVKEDIEVRNCPPIPIFTE